MFTYDECINIYGNLYQIEKKISEGVLYKIEPGFYSTEAYESDLAIISLKYPNGILTGTFAFYEHGLTDFIPDKYELATKDKAAPIKDQRVVQIYTKKELLPLGCIEKEVEGVIVKIYDKERMLIELLRNKNKLPRDLYKEIIGNYRRIIETLEIWRIQEYTDVFPKSKMIKRALSEEVF